MPQERDVQGTHDGLSIRFKYVKRRKAPQTSSDLAVRKERVLA